MDGVMQFLDMGGFAAFVWPSYALAVGGIAWIWWRTNRDLAQAEREVDAARTQRRGGTHG